MEITLTINIPDEVKVALRRLYESGTPTHKIKPAEPYEVPTQPSLWEINETPGATKKKRTVTIYHSWTANEKREIEDLVRRRLTNKEITEEFRRHQDCEVNDGGILRQVNKIRKRLNLTK